MIKKLMFACLLICFGIGTVCYSTVPGNGEELKIRRFAMAFGANDGGQGRVQLRYSITDAQSVLKILTEMGGVHQEDAFLLANPGKKALFDQMDRLTALVAGARANHRRVEVIFYYSGHSDEKHILLGEERIPYGEFRDAVNSIDADVRIAILDSCASGAFTRIKGGKKTAPFMVDRAYDMKGYAFMTSSSSDESSQESDRVKGSFFTHNLISGMRGAADLTNDGKITLNEAYQFAFNQTLAQTADSIGGPQHPNYNIRMSGTGDVVMTDVRRSSTSLLIEKEVFGKLFIRDANDTLVVELNKPGGREIELGLESGEYKITNIRENKVFRADIQLTEGKSARLDMGQLKESERIMGPGRGKGEPGGSSTGNTAGKKMRVIPFHFGFLDISKPDPNSVHKFALHIFSSRSNRLNGVGLGAGVGIVEHDGKGLQLAGIGNIVGGDFRIVQVAGMFNYIGGDAKVYQGSGFVNYIGGNGKGFQSSGMVNVARKSFKGLQASGFVNYARELSGAQLGTVNVAKKVDGAQIGVVNVGMNTKGAQIGVVNVTGKDSGYALGVVSVVAKGKTSVSFWADELGFLNTGIKHGNGKWYNMYLFGFSANMNRGFFGLAHGFHIKGSKRMFYTIDAMAKGIFEEKKLLKKAPALLASLRFGVGFRLNKTISLVVGGSYNYFNNFDREGNNIPKPFHGGIFEWGNGKGDDKHWPGLFVQLDVNL